MRLASHSVYRDFITGFGLEFFPLGGDPKVKSPGMRKFQRSGCAGSAITSRRQMLLSCAARAWRGSVRRLVLALSV